MVAQVSAHTPGPWRVGNSQHLRRSVFTAGNGHKRIATADMSADDARLLAAAPDLLDALRNARPFVAQWCRGERPRTPAPSKWTDDPDYISGEEEAWLEAAERLALIDAAIKKATEA